MTAKLLYCLITRNNGLTVSEILRYGTAPGGRQWSSEGVQMGKVRGRSRYEEGNRTVERVNLNSIGLMILLSEPILSTGTQHLVVYLFVTLYPSTQGHCHDPNLLLSLPIVDQSDFQHLTSLTNHHPPGIISLPIHNRKPPNLPRRPPLLLINRQTLNMLLPIRTRNLFLALKPSLLQEIIINLLERAPTRLALDVTEDVVIVCVLDPVERAQLGRAFDAAGCGLLDVDVGYVVFGVLLCVEGDGGEGDGFACPPADALEGEDGVGIVGEGFILEYVSLGRKIGESRKERSYHDPLTREVLEGDFCWSCHCCVD